jgi:spermidine synthase
LQETLSIGWIQCAQGSTKAEYATWRIGRPGDDVSPTLAAAVTESARLHTNRQTVSLSFETSLIQSCMRLEAPDELVLDYTRSMMGGLLLAPPPRSVLMIGLGGGSMLKYLHRHLPAADLTAVEINPGVIELRDDFHIPPDSERLRIVCADGARFVTEPPRAYDLILVDGFTGDGLPDALCSRRFYMHCRQALTPQGLLVANVQADTDETRRILKRLEQAFDGGMITIESTEGGNEIAFAGDHTTFSQALAGFEACWAGLPDVHQNTLAACSTRLQGALIKMRRPSPR